MATDSLSTQPEASSKSDTQAAPDEKSSKAKKDKLAVAGKLKKQANPLLTSN
jgi:hypothetical protein